MGSAASSSPWATFEAGVWWSSAPLAEQTAVVSKNQTQFRKPQPSSGCAHGYHHAKAYWSSGSALAVRIRSSPFFGIVGMERTAPRPNGRATPTFSEIESLERMTFT